MRTQHRERVAVAALDHGLDRFGPDGTGGENSDVVHAGPSNKRRAIAWNPRSGMPSQAGRFSTS